MVFLFWDEMEFKVMHIPEGMLSPTILFAGSAICAVGVGAGLKRLDMEDVPTVGLLSAALFVISLLHVPIAPTSVHLSMNGLAGLLLGWKAFPALLVSFLLQALLFQHGGITTLGANTISAALPAVICGSSLKWALRRSNGRQAGRSAAAFFCGAAAPLISATIVAFFFAMSGRDFMAGAKIIAFAHIPLALVEGVVTAVCINFITRVRPEMLNWGQLSNLPQEGL